MIFAETASDGFASLPSGCILNQSKTFQQSKTRNSSFLPFGSHSLCLHVASFLVPLPSICQKRIFEKTGLAKTRLLASGMSTPVSSMSTEIATRGQLSVLNILRLHSFLHEFLHHFVRNVAWLHACNLEVGLGLVYFVGDQAAILHGVIIFVQRRRCVVFAVEEPERVSIDDVGRRRGQSYLDSIEVREHVFPFVVDGAMAFVRDD